MLHRLLLALALLWLAPDDGAKQGRRGNAHYGEGQYAEASVAYQQGLAALAPDAAGPVRYGLLNNLGAALHQQGQIEEAEEAFSRALALAPAPGDRARTAYNAGNNAYARSDLERALGRYREALLADPSNEDARFNYEYVKRQMEQQQQNQQQQGSDNQQQNREENQQQPSSGDQEQDEERDQPSPGEQDETSDEGQTPRDQPEDGAPEEPEPTPQPDPNKLSRAQAERILQALQNDEEQLMREIQQPKTQPRRVKKDW